MSMHVPFFFQHGEGAFGGLAVDADIQVPERIHVHVDQQRLHRQMQRSIIEILHHSDYLIFHIVGFAVVIGHINSFADGFFPAQLCGHGLVDNDGCRIEPSVVAKIPSVDDPCPQHIEVVVIHLDIAVHVDVFPAFTFHIVATAMFVIAWIGR